ncbi:hypothetical protein [Demequina rhizosphaerae]|uniref:hypothetical protein n=1 Tax=Demequina rhizosphaerae TaxID=1638985 RepID=UPI000782B7BF|nr:hypothetical protein [Demequina rhizosphaerae]
MSAAWVAAAVRVRALVAGRAGPEGAARLARAGSLAEAGDLLARWSYGARVRDAATPDGLQRATRETLLWQLRVLAGWAPAGGTGILRAAAAEFERDNILARVRELSGAPSERPYELGALDTSWSTLRLAPSADALRATLARSAWGAVPDDEADQLADLLTAAWLQRYARVAPAARAWAARQAALAVARLAFVDRVRPGPTLRERVRPLLGRAWEQAADLPAFADSLPRGARVVLGGVTDAGGLWRAEARHHGLVETEAASLLRSARPGPDVVVAGIGLLAADAWRIQAAVAAVGSAGGAREVLDAAA